MKIVAVEAYAVKIPRDLVNTIGTAGLPTPLEWPAGGGVLGGLPDYQWAESYRTLYSTKIETTLVRVETDEGIIGWGEAQAPLAPEVTKTIINSLLGPLLIGEDPLAPERLWDRMYSAMRVRGHTGGFMLDAIAGVDIALWDIAGKAYEQPVYRLLGGPFLDPLPCYISGLAGASTAEKMAYAGHHIAQGAKVFKLFLDKTERDCLELVGELRDTFGDGVGISVDALWRLTPKSALRLARQLEKQEAAWLEAPLMPEDLSGHQRLATEAEISIAIGESYRSRFELLPFFERSALDILQPDVGRTGVTEGRKIAILADTFHTPVAPHISIGLGPQIAAALHLGAATRNLMIVECNPKVFTVANQFLKEPIDFSSSSINLPQGPGLGVEISEGVLKLQ